MAYFGPGDLDNIDDLNDWRKRVAANLNDIGFSIMYLTSEISDLTDRLNDLTSEIEQLRSSKAIGDDPPPAK